jgi:4-amino-4-deoxy-L-arabinose transferase-like glycosyltransferase
VGRRIAAGDWIGKDVFYQAPLYPYFMGLIYTVAGHDVLAVRICQAVLGSISCALIAHAAWRLFSKRAGIIAGLILALYPPAIFFDGLLQKTALDAFLVSLAIWIISGLVVSASSSWRSWVGLGATMGALSLTRENALILIAVIVVWCVLGPIAGAGRGRTALAFVFGVSLLLLPVAIRNYAVGGGFISRHRSSTNLYLGNNARTDGTAGSLIGAGIVGIRAPGRDRPRRARDWPPSDAWRGLELLDEPDAGIHSIAARSWLKLMAQSRVVNSTEAFDTESQELCRMVAASRSGRTIGNFGLLVPLAAFGVCVTWSDRRRLWIFYALGLTYAASVVLFFIYARYRFPLVPFLVLFTSAGVAHATAFLRSRSRTELAGLAALVAGLLVFTRRLCSTRPTIGRSPNTISDRRFNRKAVWLKPSIGIRRRLRSNQTTCPHSNLGAALLSSGDVVGGTPPINMP